MAPHDRDIPGFNRVTGEWDSLAPPSLPLNNSGANRGYSFDPRTSADISGTGPRHSGITFDPRTMPMSTRENRSWWQRYDDAIISFGNSLATLISRGRHIISICFAITIFVCILGVLIQDLVDFDWSGATWLGIIVGFIFGVFFLLLCWYLSAFVSFVFAWILFGPIALLRYIFYNGTSLLLTIGVIFSIILLITN